MSLADRWRDLRRALTGAVADRPDGREEASFELVRSARRFSRRTQKVVDDKLTFSATLMRAGEVDAANRLLAEVEQDVRHEEAALMERVNEVKIAQEPGRRHVTRARLVRTLAAAVLSTSVFAASAFGMAVSGWLDDDDPTRVPETRRETVGSRRLDRVRGPVSDERIMRHARKLGIAGRIELSAADIRKIERLAISGDTAELERILLSMFAPSIAEKVATVSKPVEQSAASVEKAVAELVKKVKKKATKQSSEPKEEPSPESSPEPSESPSGGSESDGDDRESGDDSPPVPLP